MNILIVVGAVLAVALLVAALVDYRRRASGDTRSGRNTWRSVRAQKAEARKRGERWGAGQGGFGGGS